MNILMNFLNFIILLNIILASSYCESISVENMCKMTKIFWEKQTNDSL